MKFLARTSLILAFLLVAAKGALASDLMIVNMQAPASLTPNAGSGAIYLTIENHGAEPDRLVGMVTPSASMAMLHEMKIEGDVMKMRALTSLDVPAGATVELKPGASHIMLMGMKAPLKAGNSIQLELTFEKSGVLKVDVPVVAKAP